MCTEDQEGAGKEVCLPLWNAFHVVECNREPHHTCISCASVCTVQNS